MIESSRYANTIAGIILAVLYRQSAHRPDTFSAQVAEQFNKAAAEFEIDPGERDELLQLVQDACHLFVEQTRWEEYVSLATGPYAAAIDLPVVLTRRMAQLT